jgi:hypothetical protein
LNLDRLWRDEFALSHHQIGTAGLVIAKVYIDELLHHRALSLAHRAHVDRLVGCGDSEFLATMKV